MAEHAPVTEDSIQSLVRGIVGEFFNSPENRNVQDARQNFSSLQDELHHRFRLPRTAVNEIPVLNDQDNNTPSTLGNRPRMLAGNSPLSSIAMPIQPTNSELQPGPEPFNALTNYGLLQQQAKPGPGPTRQRGRSRVRNSCLNLRRRQGSSASNRRNSTPASERNELFLKDICLLPSRSFNKVPRREAKLDLQKRALYIDAFTFDKRWDEKMLREKIWHLFSTRSIEIDLEDHTR